MMRARYSRWDGSQEPFGPDLELGDVLEEMADDLLMGTGAENALQRLLERGISGQTGLEDLRQRLAQARQQFEENVDVSGPLADVRDRLNEIEELERGALAQRDDPDARFAELQLDALPQDPAGAINELQQYDFTSQEAAQKFQELVEHLRQEVLDSYFQDLSSAMRNMSGDDVRELTEMLADLNAMLEARERGEEPDFDAFMAKHGHLFPEQPQNLDELLEQLARRMAAMSSLLASMSPDQRAELEALARSVLDDLDLQFQLSQLQSHLRDQLPDLPWDQSQPGGLSGESLPFSQAVEAMQRLSEFDDLEQQLRGDYPGATLEDVDEDALRETLGEDAVRDLRRLKTVERLLEESGTLTRNQGRLELTPRGARLLGERALTKLLDKIRRETSRQATGADAELTGQTRQWEFGDREPIAVQRTVANAVLRRASDEDTGAGAAVDVSPEDFEVSELEVRPRTATALLLDLSFSMPLKGHFVPAKRMALALHALIEGKYAQDSLYLVGFSDYARQMQPADLGSAGFERVYGTNMHHAFLLARRLLSDDPRPVKQVIMVTDGEPTAHLEDDVAYFNWPPVPQTISKTLREAMRLARGGISLNVFLLEDDPGLLEFAHRMSSLTGGQVFQMNAEEVGDFVLRDYVSGGGGLR